MFILILLRLKFITWGSVMLSPGYCHMIWEQGNWGSRPHLLYFTDCVLSPFNCATSSLSHPLVFCLKFDWFNFNNEVFHTYHKDTEKNGINTHLLSFSLRNPKLPMELEPRLGYFLISVPNPKPCSPEVTTTLNLVCIFLMHLIDLSSI